MKNYSHLNNIFMAMSACILFACSPGGEASSSKESKKDSENPDCPSFERIKEMSGKLSSIKVQSERNVYLEESSEFLKKFSDIEYEKYISGKYTYMTIYCDDTKYINIKLNSEGEFIRFMGE